MMDLSPEVRAKVEKRLEEEQVIWLTTVKRDGTPLPTPVWFLWDGETFLIYTLKDSLKLGNIARNPRAALNFNSDEAGDEVVVFTGTIAVDEGTPPANRNQAYLAKYREAISDIEMTPDSFAQVYSVPLRFRPAPRPGVSSPGRRSGRMAYRFLYLNPSRQLRFGYRPARWVGRRAHPAGREAGRADRAAAGWAAG